MRKGPGSVYDKWNIPLVICDTDIVKQYKGKCKLLCFCLVCLCSVSLDCLFLISPSRFPLTFIYYSHRVCKMLQKQSKAQQSEKKSVRENQNHNPDKHNNSEPFNKQIKHHIKAFNHKEGKGSAVWCCLTVTRQVSIVEQELFTFTELLTSLQNFSSVHVAQYIVIYTDYCLYFCAFLLASTHSVLQFRATPLLSSKVSCKGKLPSSMYDTYCEPLIYKFGLISLVFIIYTVAMYSINSWS